MQEFILQAKLILKVYLERGQAAVAALQAGQIDAANALLKKRSAAFHNFRAVDHASPDPALDPLLADDEIQTLWAEIRLTDRRLAPLLQAAHARTAELAHKLGQAQLKIRRYHSGEPESVQFEQTA